MLKKTLHTLILPLSLFIVLILPTPAFAAHTITITTNGAHSTNNVSENTSNFINEFQSNFSNIFNTVFNFSDTGGNKTNGNTGNTTVTTGNTTSNVQIVTTGNSNIIAVPEFSPLQALCITILSICGFLFMRKRFA